jgi:APA family basic amino acid/polyamine antiporter
MMDPQRTFPRAIVLGTGMLVIVYLAANVGYLAGLGEGAAHSQRIAAEAIGVVLGPRAGSAVSLIILVAIFSAANGTMLTTSRVYFAMAQDGLFFKELAQIHPRFGTPAFAIAATAAWAAILAASGTFEQLLTYVVFTSWIFYALGAASLFQTRRQTPGAPRPFAVPFYPWTPMLFIVSAIAIVVSAVLSQPRNALVGIVLVLSGAPAYAVWRARLARRAKKRS